MKMLVSHPSVAPFIQQAARAFEEAGGLEKFITTLRYSETDPIQQCIIRAARCLGYDLEKEFRRRTVHHIPPDKVVSYPGAEILRLFATRIEPSGRLGDWVWFQAETSFDRKVSHAIRPGLGGVYGFEHSCLATFRRAAECGIPRIYEVPAPEPRFVQDMLEKQVQAFPELRTPFHEFTRAREEERIERKRSEWRLADRIICASSFSRASYAQAGLDVSKMRIVPYGAPAPADREKALSGGSRKDQPLRIIWAGTFSIRKGAHLVIEAWRKGSLGRNAELHVYGRMEMPARIIEPLPKGIHFHGSIPHLALMEEYSRADALLFPTLCDGFGLVVNEAWSQGVPVITTACAGASELLRENETGWIIEADSSDAIQSRVEACLSQRPLLRGLRESCWNTAASWQWADYRRALRAAVADIVPLATSI